MKVIIASIVVVQECIVGAWIAIHRPHNSLLWLLVVAFVGVIIMGLLLSPKESKN